MELRVLKYFLAIVKEGSMVQAAEALHITQPTLSRQIMDLESELNCSLFIRGGKHLQLTENGMLFQQRAHEIVDLAGKAKQELLDQQHELAGTINIACVETTATFILDDVLMKFQQLHPKIRFCLYSANGDDVREKIDRGIVDAGIVIEPIEIAKYNTITLPTRDRWGVVMMDDDPLAKKKHLTQEDLYDMPITMGSRTILVNEVVGWLNIPPQRLRLMGTCNLSSNLMPMVQKRYIYPVVTEGSHLLRKIPHVIFVPLTPLHTAGNILIWQKNHMLPPIMTKFLEFFKENMTEAVASIPTPQK